MSVDSSLHCNQWFDPVAPYQLTSNCIVSNSNYLKSAHYSKNKRRTFLRETLVSDLAWVGARPRLSWTLNKSNVSLSTGIITTNTVTSPAQAATRTGTGENSKSDQPQCITVRCEV